VRRGATHGALGAVLVADHGGERRDQVPVLKEVVVRVHEHLRGFPVAIPNEHLPDPGVVSDRSCDPKAIGVATKAAGAPPFLIGIALATRPDRGPIDAGSLLDLRRLRAGGSQGYCEKSDGNAKPHGSPAVSELVITVATVLQAKYSRLVTMREYERHDNAGRDMGSLRWKHVAVSVALAGVAAAGLGSTSCYTQSDVPCAGEKAPRAPFRGRVVDGKTGAPLKGSLVFVELCGLYTDNPDPSKGNPNYRFGTIVGDDGRFMVEVPRGAAGLHTFQPGYRYGFSPIEDTGSTGLELKVEPLLPADQRPMLTDFKATPTAAAPGQEITFTVTARAATPKDPLSEEVLLLEPTSAVARALDPPSRGVQGKGYPDGVWSIKLAAPSAPGAYTYNVGVTTEGCIVGENLTLVVTVK
jgi:hypothetical protein